MTKDRLQLFAQTFVQVALISANSYFIFQVFWPGIPFCGFLISYIWTRNVKSIAVSSEIERIIYATGAMCGGLFGVLVGM